MISFEALEKEPWVYQTPQTNSSIQMNIKMDLNNWLIFEFRYIFWNILFTSEVLTKICMECHQADSALTISVTDKTLHKIPVIFVNICKGLSGWNLT